MNIYTTEAAALAAAERLGYIPAENRRLGEPRDATFEATMDNIKFTEG